MATTASTLVQAIFLATDAGVAISFATKALFAAAGWDLTWQDKNGVALASQPTWTLSAGVAGRHVVGFTNPAGQWTVKVTVPAGFVPNPVEWSGEGLTYDADALAGLFLASAGVASTDTVTTGEVTLYDGNSISFDMSVLDAALTAIGATSLADCSSMVAEIKRTSLNSDDPADVTTIVESILSDILGDRVVHVQLDAFPPAIQVLDNAQTLDCRCDLKLIKGTKIITAATREVTVRWKATTT